ncbi:hypothetical protein K438DRAFT_2028999, partial [Mycena galopus ATCC 62051]
MLKDWSGLSSWLGDIEAGEACYIPYHHGLIWTSSDHFRQLPANSRPMSVYLQ